MRRFAVLAFGPFQPADLVVHDDPENRAKLGPEQRAEVARVVGGLRQAGRQVEALPLYRLVRSYRRDGRLHLVLGRTDYAEYLGTNFAHPEWRDRSGEAALSNALAVSMALCSADGQLILERRSGRVAEGPGLYHVKPSGHPHPPQSPADGILAELHEELGLEATDLVELVCTGLVRSVENHKPELTFAARAGPAAAALLARPAAEGWESTERLVVPCQALELSAWLGANHQHTTTAGLAAMLLAGRVWHGQRWYEAVLERVKGRR